jgi:hypothetical protein
MYRLDHKEDASNLNLGDALSIREQEIPSVEACMPKVVVFL